MFLVKVPQDCWESWKQREEAAKKSSDLGVLHASHLQAFLPRRVQKADRVHRARLQDLVKSKDKDKLETLLVKHKAAKASTS